MYGFGALGGEWGGMLSDLALVPYAEAMLVPLPARREAAKRLQTIDFPAMARPGLEPGTPRFSVVCSTN
jgi:hypothetical protein